MKKLLVSLINIYQAWFSFDHGLLSYLAPGGVCRYEVSCSEYTKQSISQYGIYKGIWMGVVRIWRCR